MLRKVNKAETITNDNGQKTVLTTPFPLLTGLKHFLGRNKAQIHTGQGKYTECPKMPETQIYQQTRQNDVKVSVYIHLKFFSGSFSKSH